MVTSEEVRKGVEESNWIMDHLTFGFSINPLGLSDSKFSTLNILKHNFTIYKIDN